MTSDPAPRPHRRVLVYLVLACAIAAEVMATSVLPRTHGFSALVPTVIVIAGYVVSFALMAQVVQTMPVGIAYAIWSGVGTVAVVAIGRVWLSQHLNVWQFGGVGLVVVGVLLINLTGTTR